jgi:hypothetical protein
VIDGSGAKGLPRPAGPTGTTDEGEKTMEPNKPQQKMLTKLEEIGELEDVCVRDDVVLRLAGMRLRIEETGRLRYFDGASSDTNSDAYVGLIRLRERVAGGR